MKTRVIWVVIILTLSGQHLRGEDEPFGLFVVATESVFSESVEDAFFAAFDVQQGASLERALFEQQAQDEAQREYEAQLQDALKQREKKRALRAQYVANYEEHGDPIAYKFRNRALQKLAMQQPVPEEVRGVHASCDVSAFYKETRPCRSALSVKQLEQGRASRKERVKAFALKQAEVTRKAVATQHEMLALCHDIEMLRTKGGRYSNAHSSVIINP